MMNKMYQSFIARRFLRRTRDGLVARTHTSTGHASDLHDSPLTWTNCRNPTIPHATVSSFCCPDRSTLLGPVSRRQFSSSQDEDMEQLRERAVAWINRERGDLTPEDWFEIDDAVQVLLTKNTIEAVEISFHLIDRLAAEQGVIATLTRAEWVNGELIKRVLHIWISLIRQNQTPPKAFVEQYHPAIVAEAIDHYCSVFHEVQWSSQAAYYIIAAFNALTKSQSRHGQQPSSHNKHGLDFAAQLLEKIMWEWKNGNQDASPAPSLFQAVANACTSRTIPAKDRKRAAMLIDDILLLVAKESEHAPDAQLFAQSINAWALTRSAKGARNAHERLDQMYEARKYQEEHVPGWVWVNALRSAVNAWTWSNHKDTLRRVEVLLVRTKNFVEAGLIPATESTVPIWNAALQACAISASPAGAAQATRIAEIFNQAESPDSNTFYWYIASLVNGGELEKGEELLTDSIKSGPLEAREDFLAMVLYGWARSRHPQKYRRAKRLVTEAQKLSKGKLQLTASTYNALLECCATSSVQGQYQYFANEALRMIGQMNFLASHKKSMSVAPDVKSYTSTIRCLANCGDGKRAETLFDDMIKASKETRNGRLQPDSVVINTVLTAYNKSKDENALDEAQAFFSKCLEMHSKGELSHGPDSYSFTTLVSCIARASGEGQVATKRAKIAGGLLDQLQHLYANEGKSQWQPTTALFNAVMNCWARAGSPGNCGATLERMLQEHKNGNQKAMPDIQSFNILMKALSSCNLENAGKRADELLSRIRELHRTGVLGSGPNSYTYTTLIHCHVQSGSPEGLQRADAVLRDMEVEHEKGNLDAPPNDKTYEMVRKAKEIQIAGLPNL